MFLAFLRRLASGSCNKPATVRPRTEVSRDAVRSDGSADNRSESGGKQCAAYRLTRVWLIGLHGLLRED